MHQTMKRCIWALTILLLREAASCAAQQQPAARAPRPETEWQVATECLVIRPLGKLAGGNYDLVAARLGAGQWKAPSAGDELSPPEGAAVPWQTVKAQKGVFRHAALNGGYASVAVDSRRAQVVLLHISTPHRVVYVNGEPRTGDVYGHGYVKLPILLQQGNNELLVQCLRGALEVRLEKPSGAAVLNMADALMPDLLVDQAGAHWGAAVVINATTAPAKGLVLEISGEGLEPTRTPVPTIPPLATRKAAFRVDGPPAKAPGKRAAELRLVKDADATPLHKTALALSVTAPDQLHKRTFLSSIDGSVQYFAMLPARGGAPSGRKPALFLTLHGAGVEASGQAAAYAAKSWGHLVAPTNRRPFGFDWEEWGRLDALEVLKLAQTQLGTDPHRTYLTGHSMGGHGVWHLGVLFPDRFAAIGPSAGWISFASYGNRPGPDGTTKVGELMRRAAAPSDTLLLAKNYRHHGIYILHGDKDDNVPPGQARAMVKHLSGFHKEFTLHEQPGAGHWWDVSDEPGADCVDWAPMFDFFARRVIPARAEVRQVEFVTVNPGVSAWCQWAAIEAQQEALKPSTIDLRCEPTLRRITGVTENVARLALDIGHLPPGGSLAVHLDGQKLENVPVPVPSGATGDQLVWLTRRDGKWQADGRASSALKGPHRYGPYKDAFRNRMIFVYGTKGSPADNAALYAKARLDAERFWYAGNGAVDLVPDTGFDPADDRDRNVILFGNTDTNSVWNSLLKNSPVQAGNGWLRVGDRQEKGDDLACLFLQPRPGSDHACVAAIAVTGAPGARLAQRLTYFQSGPGYPDCVVFHSDSIVAGNPRLLAAGFFGQDWSVSRGEFAWQPRETGR